MKCLAILVCVIFSQSFGANIHTENGNTFHLSGGGGQQTTVTYQFEQPSQTQHTTIYTSQNQLASGSTSQAQHAIATGVIDARVGGVIKLIPKLQENYSVEVQPAVKTFAEILQDKTTIFRSNTKVDIKETVEQSTKYFTAILSSSSGGVMGAAFDDWISKVNVSLDNYLDSVKDNNISNELLTSIALAQLIEDLQFYFATLTAIIVRAEDLFKVLGTRVLESFVSIIIKLTSVVAVVHSTLNYTLAYLSPATVPVVKFILHTIDSAAPAFVQLFELLIKSDSKSIQSVFGTVASLVFTACTNLEKALRKVTSITPTVTVDITKILSGESSQPKPAAAASADDDEEDDVEFPADPIFTTDAKTEGTGPVQAVRHAINVLEPAFRLIQHKIHALKYIRKWVAGVVRTVETIHNILRTILNLVARIDKTGKNLSSIVVAINSNFGKLDGLLKTLTGLAAGVTKKATKAIGAIIAFTGAVQAVFSLTGNVDTFTAGILSITAVETIYDTVEVNVKILVSSINETMSTERSGAFAINRKKGKARLALRGLATTLSNTFGRLSTSYAKPTAAAAKDTIKYATLLLNVNNMVKTLGNIRSALFRYTIRENGCSFCTL